MSETNSRIRQTRNIQRILPVINADYARVTGNPFRRFFCPILHTDEETELCLGHIVNEKIPHSIRKCVVQRKDVDGFYGRVFEADFITAIRAREMGLLDAVFDESLRKKMDVRITLDGQDCDYHYHKGGKPASCHSRIILDGGDGRERQIALHMPPQEVTGALNRNWQVVVEGDYRLSALVSLIKAGYLTLFRLFGYRYVLSLAGRYVGYDLLGRFYAENHGRTTEQAKASAREFFRACTTMVRPIERVEGEPPRGTIEDRRVMACFSSSSHDAFACAVCVRTGSALHAVLLPAFTRADSVAAYFEFLMNDRETIWLEHCQYEAEKDQWSGTGEPREAIWPKDGESFDFN